MKLNFCISRKEIESKNMLLQSLRHAIQYLFHNRSNGVYLTMQHRIDWANSQKILLTRRRLFYTVVDTILLQVCKVSSV